MMLIVDAHQDLAWNMIHFGRDYTQSVIEIRRREAGQDDAHAQDSLLGWPDYQRGQVAVIFSTLFAAPVRLQEGPWETMVYADTRQANQVYRSQVDVYKRLVDDHPEKFRLINTRKDLEEIRAHWGRENESEHPVGLVILMEGAEGVRAPAELEEWWALGVRLIGPAWAGNRFCGGTREPGPLTREGFALLESMAAFGFSLDLSHMDEPAVLQALDFYTGQIVATHANAQALLKGRESNRFLSDRVIRGVIERQGVIGVVPFNLFLLPDWKKGDRREAASLAHVVAQIDYICQMAGDARHVGIGTDFDGGFGLQSVPPEIDTIADLQKLIPLLAERGYSQDDIAAILGENWLTVLQRTLPEDR